MMYIKNINQFKKANESFLNPEENKDINVEFEDTLVGVLVNKLFGKTKDILKKGAISSLANKLDKTIASLFINTAKESDNETKEKIDNIEEQNAVIAVSDYVSDILILLTTEPINIDKVNTMIEVGETLLENQYITSNDEYNKLVEDTNKILNEIVKAEKMNDSKPEENTETNTTALPPAKLNYNVILSRLKNDKNYNSLSTDMKDFIEKYYTNTNDTVKVTEDILKTTTDPKLKKMVERSIYITKQFTQENWKDVVIPELLKAFDIIYKLINKKTESLYLILENESTVSSLIKKLSDKLKPIKDKFKKEKIKVTKEDLDKIDKAIKDNSSSIVNGESLKKISDIIQTANKKMLRNNYNDLQKRQKQYWIPLSSNGNIAKNKAAYDEWSKKVNNIVSYYNEILPKKVNDLLLDSLDDDYMLNYNKLLSKYLGKDAVKSSNTPNYFDDETDTETKQDNKKAKKHDTFKISIDKVDKLSTVDKSGKTNIINKPFIIKTDKNYIVILPIYIKNNIVTCKYKANSISWIRSYMGEFKFDNTDIFNKLNRNDSEPVKVCTFRLKDTIIPQDKYKTIRSSFDIKNSDDIKEIIMKVNEIYILTDEFDNQFTVKSTFKNLNTSFIAKYSDRVLNTDDVKALYDEHISVLRK